MPSKWFLIFCFSLTTTTVTLASETILNLGNLRQSFRKGVERAKEENPYFFTNSKYVVVFELSVNILFWTTIWTSLNKLLIDGSYLISYLFNEIVWLLKPKTVPHISPSLPAPPTCSAQDWIKLVVGIQCKLEWSGDFPFLFTHSQCKGQDLTLCCTKEVMLKKPDSDCHSVISVNIMCLMHKSALGISTTWPV